MEKRIIILFECNGKLRMEQNVMFVINVSIASKVRVPGKKKLISNQKNLQKGDIIYLYYVYIYPCVHECKPKNNNILSWFISQQF